MMHRGSCHCGRIAYSVEATFDKSTNATARIAAERAICWRSCRERRTLSTPMEAMATYRFNRHAIDHHFCSQCGCAPIAFGTSPDGTKMAAVNVRCIEGIDLGALERVPVDGRSF